MKWYYKLVIAVRFLTWRIQREMPDDFWGWMYKRVTDRKSKDYGDKVLVWVLLSDALSENEHLRADAIYEKFQPMIDESATEMRQRRFRIDRHDRGHGTIIGSGGIPMNKSIWSFARAGWLAFAGLILVGCGGTPISYIRQDPELALRSTDFKTIAVVPTSADLYLGRGGEDGRLDEHSVRIAADLDRLLAEQFSDRGFDVRVVESSKVYADEVEHLMSKIKEGMYGIGGVGPATSEQIDFSLGSDVQPIADAASADVLVFTDFSGWKRSGGSVTGEYFVKIFTGGMADHTAAADMFVALVDAKSGDLLWGNKVTDRSLAMNPPDYGEGRLSDMVTEAFSELTLAREQ